MHAAILSSGHEVTSPSIDTLPIELLTEIFELTICEETHILDAFRISQVCALWREVAHASPQLWSSSVHVTIHSKGSPKADRLYRDGLKTWLARSKLLPIPLVLKESGSGARHDWGPRPFKAWDPDSPGKSYLPLSLPLFNRLAQSKPTLDSLETLYLKVIDGDPVLACGSLPRLRELNIIHMFRPKSSQLLNSWPWAQLNVLELWMPCKFDAILVILSRCTSLVRASVGAFAWSAYPSAGQADINLECLQTLAIELYEYSEGHIVPFFDRISVPALENLSINAAGSARTFWDQARFSAFQLRTPTITHLEFACLQPLSSSDLMAVLQHANHLTHLKVDRLSEAFDETIIRALTYTDGSQPLAPGLHHLVLQAPSLRIPVNFETEFWANMLLSRWWTDEQLASGTIKPTVARWTHIVLGCSQRYKPAIEALQCTGVPIECRYYA
ncbi:hypothetical protein R3P38DRAFT_3219533 [Favolaschia claudopus]|uniref:F-box domain-containing protein n=1 Tax=Favolaschia claudopus TaxID=2862362 RepID=A0AAW0A1N2_9AGAR